MFRDFLDQFEEQVARSPDRVAVVYGDTALSYAELGVRSSQLAHHLIELGVTINSVVGVHLPQSVDIIVSLIAILKAGGGYLPLDPKFPVDRLLYMLSQSGVDVVLARRQGNTLGKAIEHKLVAVDSNGRSFGAYPETRPEVRAGPDNIACVLFTSGSTGEPKGVMSTRRGLLGRMSWEGGGEDEVCTLKTTLSFVDSLLEIFMPLMRGQKIVVMSEDEMRDPILLVDALQRHHVTRIGLVPSLLRAMLVAAPDLSDRLPHLHYWSCSGEPLPGDLVALFVRKMPGRELVNVYGATEFFDVTRTSVLGETSGNVPIGYLEDGCEVYVLDDNMRPVEASQEGELYIGGGGLALGFIGNPGLTADRFLPNPFGKPGRRMYRTGDLACWRADGQLLCKGRIDYQTKVRGNRIEIPEIEVTLRGHDDIEEAVVIPFPDAFGETALAVFVLPLTGKNIGVAKLWAFLNTRLPDYMVPASWQLVDTLPLTASGKVDRTRLRDMLPESSATRETGDRATPLDELTLVVGLFEALLPAQTVSPDDDFFMLGGHSLLGVRLFTEIAKHTGVRLPLKVLYEIPTPREIAERLSETHVKHDATSALQKRVQDTRVALTGAQKRLWYLYLAEKTTAYNVPMVIEISGALERDRLVSAVRRTIEDYEILRTRVLSDGQELLHAVLPVEQVDIQVVNAAVVAKGALKDFAMPIVDALVAHRFDLETELPFRAVVIGHETGDQILAMVFHHMFVDGVSLELIADRILQHLIDEDNADQRIVAPIGPGFLDYAKSKMQEKPDIADIEFWRDSLQAAPMLELATNGNGNRYKGGPAARLSVRVDDDIHLLLIDLAARSGTTMFGLFYASMAYVLSRLAEQDDFVIGTVVANRFDADAEDIVGFLANTLPLRMRNISHGTAGDLVDRARKVAGDAIARGSVPFETIVAEVPHEQDGYRSHFFQTLLTFETATIAMAEVPGIEVRHLTPAPLDAQFDLVVAVSEKEPYSDRDRLEVELHYDTNVFDDSMAGLVLDGLERFLNFLATREADTALSDFELVDMTQSNRLVEYATGPQRDRQRGLTIPGLLSGVFADHGDAVAIKSETADISFTALWDLTHTLALGIQGLGVLSGECVVVCMPVSVNSIACQLAVWAAGATLLTIDPALPARRMAYILDQVRPVRIIAETRSVAVLSDQVNVTLFGDVLRHAPEARRASGTPPSPETPAYIIFTSGSTGRPKGVEVAHNSIVNTALALAESYDIRPGDRVLQLASQSFDASLAETLMALCVGATLVIASRQQLAIGNDLADFINRHGVTHLAITPTALTEMQGHDLPSCRAITVVGEACTPDLVERWAGVCDFSNSYGPTEAAVCATVAHLNATDRTPYIGRPIANTTCYLLDDALRPVPVGCRGELYIGGVGLAIGYYRMPTLTAEAFIPDPFGPAGSRLYRTGDLARWSQNGQLEYLGRKDDQVQIRGHRVELAEIESVLDSHPDVARTVVVLRQKNEIGNFLAAYVVTVSAEAEFSSTRIRSFAADQLPDYMVPATVTRLESFPTTINGKLDKTSLPFPDFDAEDPGSGKAPETEQEIIIAKLFAGFLGLDHVGVDDDFFALGGHSLLSLKLLSALRDKFGVKLPVSTVFDAPTVRALARRVDGSFAENQVEAAIDWSIETRMPFNFSHRASRSGLANQGEILLTGSTGLLGGALISELLMSTDAQIHCLVRPGPNNDAQKRLESHLVRFGVDIDASRNRIEVVAGDLSGAYFSLSEPLYNKLAQKVGIVFHLAADVNFLGSYQSLRSANVGGTYEVLRFCETHRHKVLHHASSKSVFPEASTAPDIQSETLRTDINPDSLGDGYSKTKWVAEQLVLKAINRGLRAFVYRIGHIAGHSKTGAFRENDQLFRFLEACIKLQAFPELSGSAPMLPADSVARTLVSIASNGYGSVATANTFHIDDCRPVDISEIFRHLQANGHRMTGCSYAEWSQRLVRQEVKTPGVLPPEIVALAAESADAFQRALLSDITMDLSNTRRALGSESGLLEGGNQVRVALDLFAVELQ